MFSATDSPETPFGEVRVRAGLVVAFSGSPTLTLFRTECLRLLRTGRSGHEREAATPPSTPVCLASASQPAT